MYIEAYEKSTQKRHLEFLNLFLTGNEALDILTKTHALGRCTGYIFHAPKTSSLSFTGFFKEQISRIDNARSRRNPNVALNKLHEFAGCNDIPFTKISEAFLISFREWLLNKAPNHNSKKVSKTIGKTTANLHMSCVMRYANRAQRKGLISSLAYSFYEIPPIGRSVKAPITFTEEEIKRLQGTPYPNCIDVSGFFSPPLIALDNSLLRTVCL